MSTIVPTTPLYLLPHCTYYPIVHWYGCVLHWSNFALFCSHFRRCVGNTYSPCSSILAESSGPCDTRFQTLLILPFPPHPLDWSPKCWRVLLQFVQALVLSANPSTFITAVIISDQKTRCRKSLFALYKEWGSPVISLLLIKVHSEKKVQRTESDFPLKNQECCWEERLRQSALSSS